MILFLMLVIEWQTVTRPYNDYEQELIIHYKISSDALKFIAEDSIFFAEYEAQIKIYDKNGNQLTGDYWERKVDDYELDISDSARIVMPKISHHYDFRIIDLHAGQILNTSEKIIQINYIGNVRWDIRGDSLMISYSIINPEGEASNMGFTLDQIQENIKLKKGTYDDTVYFYITALSNGDYSLKINTYSPIRAIDEISVPVRITRPFFLDETTWQLKVSQLEYIAATSTINMLKNTEKGDRDSLWNDFWKEYDPTPNTDYNEKEVEYFDRIAYCDEHFSHGDKGWRSDRARIYVKLGKPDEILRYPYHTTPKDPVNPNAIIYDSYEVWYYYKMDRQYIFGDRYGFGEYILLNREGSSI